jgi:predicted metal-dependent phosphotriesterase family hydrolase
MLLAFADDLEREGVAAASLRQMLRDNPAFLLGP